MSCSLRNATALHDPTHHEPETEERNKRFAAYIHLGLAGARLISVKPKQLPTSTHRIASIEQASRTRVSDASPEDDVT